MHCARIKIDENTFLQTDLCFFVKLTSRLPLQHFFFQTWGCFHPSLPSSSFLLFSSTHTCLSRHFALMSLFVNSCSVSPLLSLPNISFNILWSSVVKEELAYAFPLWCSSVPVTQSCLRTTSGVPFLYVRKICVFLVFAHTNPRSLQQREKHKGQSVTKALL